MQKAYEEWNRALVNVKQTCAVCTDDRGRSAFPSRITVKCKHKSNTCRACLSQWLSSELELKGWDRLTCPDCGESLDYNSVKKHAFQETFQRYDQLSTRAALSTIPNFHWCLKPGCGSGQIHEDSEGPLFLCTTCQSRFCIVHNEPWHDGETCAQYDKRRRYQANNSMRDEKASEKWKKSNSRLCPMCCAPIQKNGGCSAMHCGFAARCRVKSVY
ncbi:hypothetical protein BDY21DRAFT_288967 [Lineolata rhizophorae]|uniref:RBR-type E3 ubiquitin transferase n=1 Tax=Lineolata rhizophorae TaxID=578093 RepID=A0A6A6NXB4_9PEZI|nr:hypothetical protein BDY21DRAFT_288967 [Lineolata rhizophorae]